MQIQLNVLQTLADPNRFQIIEALLEGEQAVNDLVSRMDIHQSGVSRHLRILEEAGFVRVRPDGPRRLYSLRPEPFRELATWVDQYRALWRVGSTRSPPSSIADSSGAHTGVRGAGIHDEEAHHSRAGLSRRPP